MDDRQRGPASSHTVGSGGSARATRHRPSAPGDARPSAATAAPGRPPAWMMRAVSAARAPSPMSPACCLTPPSCSRNSRSPRPPVARIGPAGECADGATVQGPTATEAGGVTVVAPRSLNDAASPSSLGPCRSASSRSRHCRCPPPTLSAVADKREALKNELSELIERGRRILEAEEDALVAEHEREQRRFDPIRQRGGPGWRCAVPAQRDLSRFR